MLVRGGLVAALLGLVVQTGACRSLQVGPQASPEARGRRGLVPYLEDHSAFVRDPARLPASLRSAHMWVPAALFGGAGLLQIRGADARLQHELSEQARLPGDRETLVADTGLYVLSGSALCLPFVFPPRGARERGRAGGPYLTTYLETTALTLAATEGTRSLDLRRRPNGHHGGFFSGHASHGFAAATLLAREYGPWVGAPAYALAGLVGFYRSEDGRHFPGDVLVGAGVGILIADLVYDKDFGPHGYYAGRHTVSLAPIAEPRRLGLLVRLRW